MNHTVYKTVLQCLQDVQKLSSKLFPVPGFSPQQCTLPSGPECQRCWPSCGFASSLPDLAPCAFFLFPRLKITLKRAILNEIIEIQLNTTWQLQAILKQVYHRQ